MFIKIINIFIIWNNGLHEISIIFQLYKHASRIFLTWTLLSSQKLKLICYKRQQKSFIWTLPLFISWLCLSRVTNYYSVLPSLLLLTGSWIIQEALFIFLMKFCWASNSICKTKGAFPCPPPSSYSSFQFCLHSLSFLSLSLLYIIHSLPCYCLFFCYSLLYIYLTYAIFYFFYCMLFILLVSFFFLFLFFISYYSSKVFQ